MNTKKMQVLYIEQTGHILAAFTREAAAESLIDVSSLVGTDLIVRNEKANPSPLSQTPIDREEAFSVPIELLKPEIVDLNENAFVMPFNFMVGGGQANEIDGTGTPVGTDQTLTNNDIQIKLPQGPPKVTVSEDSKIWVQVQEKNDPLSGSEPIRRIVEGVITKPNPSPGGSDGNSVTLTLRTRPDEQPAPIPLTGKTYFVLVLVAGRKPLFFTKP